jgi:hypothetical protein
MEMAVGAGHNYVRLLHGAGTAGDPPARCFSSGTV